MDQIRCFLDTCIFLACVYDSTIEKWSEECNALFDLTKVSLHTSESVNSELEKVSKRRKKFYQEMICYYQNNKDLSSFNLDEMNANDRSNFEKIIDQVKRLKKGMVLPYLRQLIYAVDMGIKELFDKIKKPLIARHKDPYKEDLIQAIIQNRHDSVIVCDFIAWAIRSGDGYFTTLDENDVLQNREKLIEHIQKYWDACTDDIDFLHVETIVHDFRA